MKTKINNWRELKFVIAAASVTAMIGLWNSFSRPDASTVAMQAASGQASNSVTRLVQPSMAQAPTTINGRILLGGPPPSSFSPSIRRRNNAGGQPVAQTRSS